MPTWSEVARSGDAVECRPAGQTIRFLETADDTDGEYVRVEIRVAADASEANALEHVHPHQDETLSVVEGTMGIAWNGTRETLEPDEDVTFEAGDAHAFWNAGSEELRLEAEVRPALQTDLFMRFALGLSEVGRTTKSGIPLNPLRLALLTDELEGHLYLAGVPVSLQQLGARLLAPLARLRGYSLDLDDGYERSSR